MQNNQCQYFPKWYIQLKKVYTEQTKFSEEANKEEKIK